MARLLNWPIGIPKVEYQRLTGPRTAGSSSSESLRGFVQTVSSTFGLWRYQITLRRMRGRVFRRFRGMVTALHGGANAVRVTFCDPDGLSYEAAGVNTTGSGHGVPWSNGQPWSNGCDWHASRPSVPVRTAAAKGATVIRLESDHWGENLEGGEWIGFWPFHFGKYEITEVIGGGRYRIWPPLRKAIDTDTYATLKPVMVMRLESESGGPIARGVFAAESATLTLVEVEDQDVRRYFTG
jgi:hypothetical protein